MYDSHISHSYKLYNHEPVSCYGVYKNIVQRCSRRGIFVFFCSSVYSATINDWSTIERDVFRQYYPFSHLCSHPRRELDINRWPEYSGKIVCEIQYQDIKRNVVGAPCTVIYVQVYFNIRLRAYDIIIIIMRTFHSRNRFTHAGRQVQREPRWNDVSKVNEIM